MNITICFCSFCNIYGLPLGEAIGPPEGPFGYNTTIHLKQETRHLRISYPRYTLTEVIRNLGP